MKCWCQEYTEETKRNLVFNGLDSDFNYECSSCEKKRKWKKINSKDQFKLLAINELCKSEPNNFKAYSRIQEGLNFGIEVIPLELR